MKTIIRNSYTPKIGDYCNALVIDKETEKQYFFDADGVWTLLTGSAGEYYTKSQVDAHIEAEAEARESEDERIWDKIEDIEMSSDVVDVVGTMADLSNYDTSTLSDNDLVKVLQDNTHGDAISYYRWDTATNQFSYVGSEGPYYTQSQTDSLLEKKADYTIFYVPASATGPTRRIYKNADMTGEATVQDLIDANNAGAVVLRLSTAQYPEDYSDSYLQNAFIAVNNSDYEFVFLDDRSTHTYSADETTDSVFDYYKVDLQAKLTAGTNITISGTTISATDTDTTYSAGTGLNLNGTTFSIDNTVALKSEIPTATSQLNNDSGFIDNTVSDLTNYYTKTETYTQGEVNGLINSITVPTKTSDLQNDSGFITASDYASSSVGGTIKVGSGLAIDADGVLSATGGGGGLYTAGTGIDITNDVISVDNTIVPYFSDLSTVATTGSYNDLSDTPTIPAAQVNADWNASSGVAQILNKPTIPTVNNATLTIQENGSQVATFTANAASDVTANIAVPVNTSDLNNDSGFITNTDYAGSSTGGVIKVGSGLSIDASGVLSATGGSTSRYDASWILSGGTATQAQYDGLSAAISAGDIIYASSDGYELLSDYYGNNNGNLSVTFTYTQIITKDGAPATMVYTLQAAVNGTTKAITNGNISTYALRMSDIPTKTSDLTNDGSDGTSTYVEADDLPSIFASVAFSGSYNDLLNTPTIPAAQIQSDWTQADNTKLDYIKNKPTIPIVNDATLTITQNGVTAGTFTANSNVGTTVALTDTTYSNFVGTDGTAAGTAGLVPAPATTDAGEYLKADGTWDTPPGVNYTAGTGIDITGATISVDTSVVAEVSDIPTKTSDLTNDGDDGVHPFVATDDLATVATSGSYNDLLNKPTIPTVNNATLTIQKNGSQVATFTANASSNVTANIAVPVNTSDLNNDSGFITATDYADASTGGVVKVGTGLSIDASGVLSATGSGGTSRYDASWLLSESVATQTHYDEFAAAIAAGDIIYAGESTVEVISTLYGNNGGDLYATFTYTQVYDRNGTPATVVTTIQASVDGTTKAITLDSDGAYIPLMSDIPTKTSELTNDGSDGTSNYVEYSALAMVAITGSYVNLSDKPTIPTVNDATLTITQNGTTAGTFSANASAAKTIALTDTTYSAFTGASSGSAGTAGLVPAPTAGDQSKYLKADGTWSTVPVDQSYDPTSSNAQSGTAVAEAVYDRQYFLTPSNAGNGITIENYNIPPKYTRVEYIKATSTSTYILTNLTPNINSVIEAKVYSAEPSDQFVVSSSTYRIAKFSSNHKVGATVGSTNYTSTQDGTTPVVVKIDGGKVYIDGTLIGDGSGASLSSLGVININRGVYGTSYYYGYGRFYYVYISINGTDPDFYGYPVKDENGIYGLFDVIHQKFYPSDGTNDFTGGADLSNTLISVDWAAVGDVIYPVNSIVTFYDTADHSNFLGLTWERVASGKMIVGYDSTDTDFDTIGETGGSKTHQHNLSSNGYAKIVLRGNGDVRYRERSVPAWQENYYVLGNGGLNGSDNQTYGAELGGATDSANGMPPYLVASLWRRTA